MSVIRTYDTRVATVEGGPGVAGWGGFGAWAAIGALLALSLLGDASIGLFVFPLALLGLWLVGSRVRAWPEMAGVLEGVAALNLFVGIANLGSTPCPAAGSGTVQRGGGPASASSCGGFDPLPWLVVAVALAVIGLLTFVVARERL